VYLHKETGNRKQLYSPLQTSRVPEIQTKVERVDDSPGTFVCTPISVSGTHARPSDERAANLERTIRELRNQLAESQQTPSMFPATLTHTSLESCLLDSKIAGLEKTVQELRDKLADSQHTANREKTDLNETIQDLRIQLADAQRKVDGVIRINHAHEQRYQCESLYAQGRIQGAAECLLEFLNIVNEDVRSNKVIIDFLAGEFRHRALGYSISPLLSEFTPRCITALERVGDGASNAVNRDEAVAAYSTVLLLSPTTTNAVLTKWASIMLSRGSADEASSAAAKVCSR